MLLAKMEQLAMVVNQHIFRFRFCLSDEDKLKWAFRLYDMDNNGVIDMDEMAAIIETLDCIEGVKPGSSTRD